MNHKEILMRAVGMALSVGVFSVPMAATLPINQFVSIAQAAAAVKAGDVVLVGTVQSKLGAGNDWAPADGATLMKPIGNGKYQFKGKLPKGNYEYKIAIGGSWNENYGAGGASNGGNIALKLSAPQEVTFTYDSITHQVTAEYAGMAEAQAAQKKAEAAQGRTIVLTGTVQSRAGAAKDWDPGDMATRMKPMGDDFYSFAADLPAGTYYYKISVNGSWAENYGLDGNFDGANVQLTLPKAEKVTFYYNDKTHRIMDSTSYTMLKDADLPRISGSFGSAAGDGLMRDMMLDQFYQKTIDLKVGNYQVKVAQPGHKTMEQNIEIKQAGPVVFYYDSREQRLIADDGRIHADKVYHDTWSKSYRAPFEAIKAGSSVKLSLTTGKDEVQKVKLVVYKAKITANGGDEYNPDYSAGTREEYPMIKAGTHGENDLWSVSISPKESGIYGYKFVLNDTKEYGDDAKPGHTGELKLRGVKLFQLTVYSADYHTPNWAKEAVVYQIFPDRFFNGDKSNDNAKTTARGSEPVQHRAWSDLPANHSKSAADGDQWDCNDFFGGDLAGITQKLDYLQNLGVTAIYVNPLMSARSNHRYDTADYGSLDAFLGNMDDFHKLKQEMDKRGMHLIMDGVFNHVGDDSIYFDRYGKYKTVGAYEYWSRIYDLMNTKHMKEAAAKIEAKKQLEAEGQVFSPYHWENWFEIKNQKAKDSMGDKYVYHDWQGFDSLTPFRDADYPGSEQGTTVSSLGDYLLYGKDAVITKWFQNGLDAWRMDVAKEVPPGFWRNVRQKVKSMKTTRGEEPLLLAEIWQDGTQFLTGDQFDSVMNYKLSFAVGDLFLNRGDAKAADDELTILRQNYPKEALYDLMNIVDSHDTVRAIYKFGGGKENVVQASRQDFDYRLGKARLKLAATFLMGYPGMPTIYYGDEAGQYGSSDPDCRRTYPWGSEDKDLIAFYRKVIGVRNDHKALFAHGDVNTLKADGDIYAFVRTAVDGSGQAAIVALNRGAAKTVVLDAGQFADGAVFTDQISGVSAAVSGGRLVLDLGENQGMLLLKD